MKKLKKNFKLNLSLNQYYKQCLSLRLSKSPKAWAQLGLAWFISQVEIKLNIKFKLTLLIKIQYKYIIKPILSLFLCLFAWTNSIKLNSQLIKNIVRYKFVVQSQIKPITKSIHQPKASLFFFYQYLLFTSFFIKNFFFFF